MRILILGSGVIGVTSAWYLRQAGLVVVVVDRASGPAMESSFGNAGRVSPGYASPVAGRHPAQGGEVAAVAPRPLAIKPTADRSSTAGCGGCCATAPTIATR